MINRRAFLGHIATTAFAAISSSAIAQSAGKVWRVGFLSTAAGPNALVDALRETLTKLGYVEGRNISYEYRWAAGREERVQDLADELVRLKVDAIVTQTTFVTAAAKRATHSIPIVMLAAANPVALGLIASLARPGGNVTGMTTNSTETDGKRLQLLREVVPNATRVATLTWDKSPIKPYFLEQIRAAAKRLGVTIIHQEVGAPEAFAGAFAAMQKARAQGLVVQSDPFTNNHIKRIVDLAALQRLPAIYQSSGWINEGGLMYYGPSSIELARQSATYVDRILKGAKPADLPVEEPTKYELVINLKAAKALGLSIPQSILLQATQVIK